jgi:hypothetical protein
VTRQRISRLVALPQALGAHYKAVHTVSPQLRSAPARTIYVSA